MQFSRLAESAITDKLKSELPPKVLLYHGTSSGKISKIMDQGLRVPRGSIYDYLMKVGNDRPPMSLQQVHNLYPKLHSFLKLTHPIS